MTAFTLIALVMILVAAAFLVVPLMRGAERHLRNDETASMPWVGAVIVLLLVPIVSLGLYAWNTKWSWDAPHGGAIAGDPGNVQAQSMLDAVANLEARLTAQGGTVGDWTMLGRGYQELGNSEKALWAFGEAYKRDGGSNPIVIVDYATAMVVADPSTLNGPAGALFEQALEKDPNSQPALWFGGMAARVANNPELARERWTRLLQTGPPEDVAELVRQAIASVGGEVTGATAAVAPAPAEAPAGAGIRLNIDIAPELKSRLNGPTPLFIFARNAGGGGPPIAVLRRSSDELPSTFSLTDRNAMLPGTSLSSFDRLQLVARVSMGGTPVAQPGDFFGQVDYSMSEEGPVDIVINQVVP